MLEARKDTCESLLDFACGYGRALRFFRAAFPEAKLVASDISTEAVDFCTQEFGALPVYSHEDPHAIDLPGPFDVIWVGSLFSHVPESRWIEFLDLLTSVLSEDGLLVFTVQGRNVRRQLLSGELEWSLTEADTEQIVRGYDETGFGYADWIGATSYGTTLNRPSWVTRQIEDRPGLRLVGYRETGWGRQDVVTCQATGK
jgi:SAM-dependent methyltransferase